MNLLFLFSKLLPRAVSASDDCIPRGFPFSIASQQFVAAKHSSIREGNVLPDANISIFRVVDEQFLLSETHVQELEYTGTYHYTHRTKLAIFRRESPIFRQIERTEKRTLVFGRIAYTTTSTR